MYASPSFVSAKVPAHGYATSSRSSETFRGNSRRASRSFWEYDGRGGLGCGTEYPRRLRLRGGLEWCAGKDRGAPFPRGDIVPTSHRNLRAVCLRKRTCFSASPRVAVETRVRSASTAAAYSKRCGRFTASTRSRTSWSTASAERLPRVTTARRVFLERACVTADFPHSPFANCLPVRHS